MNIGTYWNVSARLLDGNSKHFAARKSVAAVAVNPPCCRLIQLCSCGPRDSTYDSDSFGAGQP